MPVLDLKLYTSISVCVALVAFLYSCNILDLSFNTLLPQKWPWPHITIASNSVDETIEYQTHGSNSKEIDKGPIVATSVFQNMLAERYLTPAIPVGSMGPLLTSLFNFLQKEKICVMIFINLAYCFLFILGRLTLKFFFGELRVIESQHMYDRLLNFLLFKVVFVGAILEPNWEGLLIWTTWFTILGFLRIFIQTLVKYVIHLRDLSRQGVWESRGLLLYYTEFVTDTLILIATLGHYLHIMIIAYRNYRKAISNMQTQYPNATDMELNEYNDDCAICRDSMSSAKRLPCGHMFHLSCLRSWLEHHGSCPTCRRPLLKDTTIKQNLLEHLHMDPFQQINLEGLS
ncbi:8884_t:CDS:2 [Diversispora eburnea]|uniref:8884_t:CDS:1 n=1 Tax=Diversispora eburnea TaxID=1213867 RepID=A0A9N8V5F4_9GLOM|nr:8884_t:CDS:2 [Diversispora eburnea]